MYLLVALVTADDNAILDCIILISRCLVTITIAATGLLPAS
jgi:hypothetical protein